MIQDGFMLFYVKDKKAHSVAMSNEQWDILQAFIPAIFGNETIQVVESDMGDVVNMSEERNRC